MTEPLIQHIGHAGIHYKYKHTTLTMDPWFNPAFLRSWFPYPDNRDFMEAAWDSDYIYISHAHEDHFDRKFFEMDVDPTHTTVIIPGFRSKFLQHELEELGFDVETGSLRILSHGEQFSLSDHIRVTMLIDKSHKEDSALLVQTPEGHRFLNSNDCELAIPDWPKNIDLLACQFSGAFWYPHCYEFSARTMADKGLDVRKNNLDRLARRVELTGARSYLPSAGPPVFLDPALQKYNFSMIFPLWDDVSGWFRHKFPQVTIHPFLRDYEPVNEYSKRRYNEWAAWYFVPPVKGVSFNELYNHLNDLTRMNKRFVKSWYKDLLISSDRYTWQVRMGLVKDTLEEAFNPTYFMDVPPLVLRKIIDGEATWETALLSQRITLRRTPDVYDSVLMGLLNFGDRPVQTLTMAKQRAADEFVNRGGYTFQRWCPHAGEDLSCASVADGKIVCPRHEWTWDARTGKCISGGDIPLVVKEDNA